MGKGFTRRLGATVLVSAVWFGSTAILPVSVFAQQDDTAKTQTDKKNKKKDKAKADAQKQTQEQSQNQTVAVNTSPNKPLTDNENPALIGKRKINGGSDKFFGWLGGSQNKEIAIGRQMAMEVEQQAKLVDDPVITEYVNRVGQNIVLHSDAKVPFTIKVIDSDEVNAFALPGGFFYVNKGLILAADNESELAGVMAHEIAHVAARHAMEGQGKGTLMNYGMLAGMILGGPIVATVLQNGGGLLGGLAMLKFTRADEQEADNLGVQYLYAAGYDPTGLSTMFEKLAAKNKKKPGTVSKLFSSHPQDLSRRDASLSLVARFPEREEYVLSTSEFQRVKSHLLSISNARAGVSSDIDDNGGGRPTLKKRQQGDDAASDDSGSSSSSDSMPPKLKKRGEESETKPPPQK